MKRIYAIFVVMLFLMSGMNVENVRADETVYRIRINIEQNYMNIYRNQETMPAYTIPCSYNLNIIAAGQFYIINTKEEWRGLATGEYGRYASGLSDTLCITTSPYSQISADSLVTNKYNGIGESESDGNIWVNCKSAKWIYDHCGVGTTVEIYADSNEKVSSSLSKPEIIKIPQDSENAAWDPSDEDISNPWNSCAPKIVGTKNLYTTQGQELDIMKAITGYDTCGNDVTERILVMGDYDFSKAGTYEVSYYLEDALGAQISESVTLTVNPEENSVNVGDVEEKQEKTNKEKIKVIVILGVIALLGTIGLIRYTRK